MVTPAPGAAALPAEDDVTPPVLNSVSVPSGTYRPGDTITVSYTATDDSPIVKAVVDFRNQFNDRSFLVVEQAEPVSGKATLVVPQSAWTGEYAISTVRLTDAKGNTAVKPIALGVHRLTIAGTTNDGEPPRLTSLSLVKKPTYADEPAVFAYTATDDSALTDVTVGLKNGLTGGPDASAASPTKSGTVTARQGLLGENSVSVVVLRDAQGNWAQYHADGRVDGFWSKHTLDFGPASFSTRPGAPAVTVHAMPRGAQLDWPASEEEGKYLFNYGYRVTVNPGAKTYDVPVGTYDEAARGHAQRLVIGDLTPGVTYTLSVAAQKGTESGRASTRTVRPVPSTNIFSPGDVTRDGRADIVAMRTSDQDADPSHPMYVYPVVGAGSFRTRQAVAHGYFYNRIAPAGPTSGLFASFYGVNDYSMERQASGHTVSAGGAGWSAMRFIDGGSDFSGDGESDILAVTQAGVLYRYTISRYGRVVARTQIGSGWGAFLAVFSPGDFNGDRKADVLALDTAGRLWLYRGSGTGGWLGSRVQIGSGWGGFGAVFPLRDFNGDGRMDVGAVKMTGELLVYPGNGRGGWAGSAKQVGSGWNQFF